MNKYLKFSFLILISMVVLGCVYYLGKKSVSSSNTPITKSSTGPEWKSPYDVNKDDLIKSLNEYRQSLGISVVTGDDSLDDYAAARLKEIVETNNFSHDTKIGTYFDWNNKRPYHFKMVQEDLSRGYISSNSVIFDGWRNSSPHNKSITDKRFSSAGFAIDYEKEIVVLELGQK